MRRASQLLPGLILALALAALAALLPVGTKSTEVANSSGLTPGGVPNAYATPPDGSEATAATEDLTVAATPTASGARREAGTTAPSTARPLAGLTAVGGATYQGVTAKTVKWGFSAQEKGCGGFSQAETRAGFGINSNDTANFDLSEEYWNKFPLAEFPLPAEIRANVNAEKGYWGRKIISVFRDSGGLACQEVGRANAVTMAETDKVFGLIMPPTDGPEVPMSLVMAQHKLLHIGRWLTGPKFWKDRAPYFWDGLWGDGVQENIALGSWVCRDWVGRNATVTGDVRVNGLPRKFGVLHTDDPDSAEVAGTLLAEVRRCGMTPKAYALPIDLATLESQSQTVTSRMIQDGVTTILSVNDFLTRLLVSKSATGQGWHPEWVNSGWGIGSYPLAYSTFMAPDQAINAWAAADAASSVHPPFNKSEPYLAFKRIRPNEEPDDGWSNYYYQFKLLALGMAGAGPNLNPTTFGEGLARLCNPCPRSNPLMPLLKVYPGHWANREGFTLVKWNTTKDNHFDLPGPDGRPKKGYFDFLENGKRYGLRITDPDPGN